MFLTNHKLKSPPESHQLLDNADMGLPNLQGGPCFMELVSYAFTSFYRNVLLVKPKQRHTSVA
jgi:hypothetical protein